MDLVEFLKSPGVILDVRSPAEYVQGRIPGAFNLPLFDNSERAAIGTAYKKTGKDAAVELGISFVGPKLSNLLRQAKQHVGEGPAKIHCWRGGMRSSSLAWLLKTAGLQTSTLKGGYKTFRRWALSTLTQPYRFHVIGGFTGSGKTAILQQLKLRNEQVLDLEELASHRGSTYGLLGMPLQPSTEQFENEIAFNLNRFSSSRPIWIEDESRMIGKCKIPDPLYNQMRSAPLFFIERSLQERIESLLEDYGSLDSQALIDATERISKRLGGKKTQEIVSNIQSGDLSKAIELSLQYYDSTYCFGLSKKLQSIMRLQVSGMDAKQVAEILSTEGRHHA
jgi:tRNA 2-selenouridine synthase